MHTYRRPVTVFTNWDEVPIVMDLPMASRIVGSTPESLKRRALNGTFPAYKEGKNWRIEKDQLRAYMAKNRVCSMASVRV